MAANPKSKEIQVQKPAQSLQHFQAKVASGDDLDTGILQPVLGAVAVVAIVGLGWFGFEAWRAQKLERHEAALAELLFKVEGDGATPVPPAELEQRYRANLPALEALAVSAPSSRRAIVQGMAASWKLQLEGKGNPLTPDLKNPWSRIREAQRLIAKGDAAGATTLLEPLRKQAEPQAPWGQLWWTPRVELHRLKGDRAEALKDVADYKARFKQDADGVQMDKLLQGI